MLDRPIREDSAAINKFAVDRAEDPRVIRADAVISHDEVHVLGDADGAVVTHVLVLCGNVRLVDGAPVNIDNALANLDILSRQPDNALDERFRMVERIPEDDDVAALDGL